MLTNIIPSKRKITGFSLKLKNEYIPCSNANEHETYTIQLNELDAVINYDDGSTEPMTAAQLAAISPASE